MRFFRTQPHRDDDEEPRLILETPQGQPDVIITPPPAALMLPPAPTLSDQPYSSGVEHLWDELNRIDQLIRAQSWLWQATTGSNKPQEDWSGIDIIEAELKNFLKDSFTSPFTLPALPADLTAILTEYWEQAESLAQAIQFRRKRTPASVRLRLDLLQNYFELSNLARDLLLISLLPVLEGRYRRLFGYLQDDPGRTCPPFELALQILHPLIKDQPEEAWNALTAQAPLLKYHLLSLSSEARSDESLATRPLRADDRIVRYLLNNDMPDDRLRNILVGPVEPLPWNELVVEAKQLERLEDLARGWQAQLWSGAALFLHGPSENGQTEAARALCTAVQIPLLIVRITPALLSENWEQMVDLCYREAVLQEAAMLWQDCDLLLEPEQPAARWQYLLAATEQFKGLTFLVGQRAWETPGRFRHTPFVRLEFPLPGYNLRLRLWDTCLPPEQDFARPTPDRDSLIKGLANSFQLSQGKVRDAIAIARWLALQRQPHQPALTLDDLYIACRRQSSQQLNSFARRIESPPGLTFSDLILPRPNYEQLEELRRRILYHRQLHSQHGFERRLSLGKGLIALFTGSSGTGKTMAAELLAREQGVDLYKINMSAVVSKYVGETEKNLERIFNEAEEANAMLLFDEADSIFGKRSEVKDAQDKWANMETNYLLQRVEEYTGVVILTSNLRQNIDEAFLRRISAIVEFPYPEAEARFRIWQGMFPKGVKYPEAELKQLAERFHFSGGSIKNIVVDAAFRALAASEGRSVEISLRQLALSIAREYQKMGKPITKGEVGETLYNWIEQDLLQNSKDLT